MTAPLNILFGALTIGFIVFVLLEMRSNGWGALTKAYRASKDIDVAPACHASANLIQWSGGGSGRKLLFSWNTKGLHVDHLPVIRHFWPAIFIPWDEIAFSDSDEFGFHMRLTFSKALSTPICVDIDTGVALRKISGRR